MAIVNPLLNVKDSRWLQLEVCREFQRNKCTRSDSECKFAHPGSNVEIQNGRVIACYDSIKERCNREKPPCKYFHPPKHLKEQLIINGKNHLALKNALLHQVPFQTVLAGQLPMVGSVSNLLNAYQRNPVGQHPASLVNAANSCYPMAAFASALNGSSTLLMPNSPITKAPNPYLSALAAASSAYGAYTTSPAAAAAMLMATDQFSPYGLATNASSSSVSPTANNNVNTNNSANTKVVRTAATVPESNGNNKAASLESHVLTEVAVANAAAAAAAAAGRKRTRDSSDELLMQISGTYPITKRPALDKNGTPLFHSAAPVPAYAQPFAVHQPLVPLSFYFPLISQTNTIPRY